MRPGKMAVGAVAFATKFRSRDLQWSAWPKLTVYPGLQLTFNRIKKNASSTMTYLLREMETGEVETVIDSKKRPRKFVSASYPQIWGVRKHHFFIVTRNPYSRVLSAFLDKFRHDEYRDLHGKFDLTPDGFQTFVHWLSDGGLAKDAHWDLQSKQMFVPLSSFDSVVRFESLKADTVTMLSRCSLEPPAGRLDALYPSDINKGTSAGSKLHRFYSPELADQVAQLYSDDFAALGYTKAFPDTPSQTS